MEKDNKIIIESGAKTGEAEITVYINKGSENEKKVTCSVSVTAEPVKIQYRIYFDNDSYLVNDGAKLYAWCWGGRAGSGKWFELSYQPGTNYLYFTAEDNTITNCKVYRFDPNGFVEPSNDENKAWNCSIDLTFEQCATTYVRKK